MTAGAGTLAYFSDTETSAGNMFTAGTMDLKNRDGGEDWGDGVTTAEWTMSDMVPGVTFDFGGIDLRNDGSLSADHMEISCSYTVTEGFPFGDPDNVDTSLSPDDFGKYLEITDFAYYNDGWKIEYDGTTFFTINNPPQPPGYVAGDWVISNTDGVGGISLCDFKNDPLDNLPFPSVNGLGTTHFEMTVKFRSDAGNDLQGDTLTMTMTFTANQDSSQ